MRELYLSRMTTDLRSALVRRDLADCYQMHRTVMALFGPIPRESSDARVLYRIEMGHKTGPHPYVLIQSPSPPAWSALPERYLLSADANPESKRIDGILSRLQAGQMLRFRLRANPTRKIRVADGSKPLRPARVDLRGHDHLMGWIERKAEGGGFDLLHVDVAEDLPPVADVRWQPSDVVRGAREKDGERARLTFGAVIFDGRLRVRDPVLLSEAIKHGIGSAKGFGFGLLSLAPLTAS